MLRKLIFIICYGYGVWVLLPRLHDEQIFGLFQLPPLKTPQKLWHETGWQVCFLFHPISFSAVSYSEFVFIKIKIKFNFFLNS